MISPAAKTFKVQACWVASHQAAQAHLLQLLVRVARSFRAYSTNDHVHVV
jgi:hypothetical protein